MSSEAMEASPIPIPNANRLCQGWKINPHGARRYLWCFVHPMPPPTPSPEPISFPYPDRKEGWTVGKTFGEVFLKRLDLLKWTKSMKRAITDNNKSIAECICMQHWEHVKNPDCRGKCVSPNAGGAQLEGESKSSGGGPKLLQEARFCWMVQEALRRTRPQRLGVLQKWGRRRPFSSVQGAGKRKEEGEGPLEVTMVSQLV
ncbi:uncharacterized protein EI90DRAFT_3140879 [Cantharellus anzutake]|uniref:uncharacterized protein n=1 Tax=Cantharellus anzutake TaxID=1750568 RepID=UPI001905A2E9|nr:uncharacterized protein EI90DRAFT_3140879 [Cantharellus anzutake]KAF8309248.1 hypothetical protein EI90DRAFT_3140879 [Cantharellus anzutake]